LFFFLLFRPPKNKGVQKRGKKKKKEPEKERLPQGEENGSPMHTLKKRPRISARPWELSQEGLRKG
jgi:hypothetical protein